MGTFTDKTGTAMATTDETALGWAATRRGLAETIATIDVVLPGSVVTRRMRCGKTNCACRTDDDRAVMAPTTSGRGPLMAPP